MPEPDFVIRANDTVSVIRDTLEDSTGAAVSIQGATVRFHLVARDRAATVLNAAASNDQVTDGTDGSKGKVSYTWQAADTTTPGFYLGEWQVTYAGGSIQSFPNAAYVLVYVSPEVA